MEKYFLNSYLGSNPYLCSKVSKYFMFSRLMVCDSSLGNFFFISWFTDPPTRIFGF